VTAVDLTDAELYRDGFPHDVFTTLRDKEPVLWQASTGGAGGERDPGFWVLTKHDDVQTANRDPESFSSLDGPQLQLVPGMRGEMLVSMDAPAHTRQRRLINSGFTPRMVRRLDEQARHWAMTIIDRALEHGGCDFVHDVAYQLPMHMIADIVGIPVSDREYVFSLASSFLGGSTPASGKTPEEYVAVQAELFGYAQQLGRVKRSHPEDDVWTILSTVEVQNDDGGSAGLRETELDLFFMLLTVAGSETTRDAISLGLLALLENPEQFEKLRTDPDIMPNAVEEILRWASPVSYFARRATRDVEIRGVGIEAGDRVTLWYPSANRDEDVFDDPFRFDIGREPNPHVAFGGGGPHYCLGANLAKREITILFEELLARTTRVEAVGPPTYNVLGIDNPILVAVDTLPVHIS
jgi:cytochrome P450